ncbi:MAG: GYD domain-containing protein [Candidatus Bathyarchaeota archaeon]|nr:GYD domain-containing protein [Candidatus Bathyarchaeota archaeon]
MQNFVVLGNWTNEGMRNVASAPERIKTTRSMVEKAGGKMQLYLTMGEYDFVMIVQIPKDEDMAAIMLCVGSMGNIRTKTMKAWTEEESTKLLTAQHP